MLTTMKLTFALAVLSATALNAYVFLKPVCYTANFGSLDGIPEVGREFGLSLTVVAVQDFPGTTVALRFPGGIELRGGDTSLSHDFSESETLVIPYRLATTRPGAFRIDAAVRPMEPDSFHWEEGASYYLISGNGLGVGSDTCIPGHVYNVEPPGLPPPEPSWGHSLHLHGTVYYYSEDNSQFVPLPDVVIELFDVAGDSITAVNSGPAGDYDLQINNLASGIYMWCVFSINSAAQVHGWPIGWPYILARSDIPFSGDTDWPWSPEIRGNPDGWYRQDVCQTLVNMRKSKEWAARHFGWTVDFATVMHPVPDYTNTCYVPRVRTWGRYPYFLLTSQSGWLQS